MKISKQTLFILIVLLAGLVLRLIAAATLPLTNDEGSYLYDAYLLGQGHLPFLTSFSRAPALMAPLALWLKIFGVSVVSGRLLAILFSLSSAVSLYLICKEIKKPVIGFWALTIYSLVSPIAIHGSYLLTEQLEIFYCLLGSLFLLKTVNRGAWLKWAILSGLFFGLGEATRETAVVYPLFLGMVLLFIGWRNKRAMNVAITIGVAALSTVLTWAVIWTTIASQVGLIHVVKNFEAVLNMHNTGEKLSLGFILRGKLAEFWYLRIDYGILYTFGLLFAVLTVAKKWFRRPEFWILMGIAAGPILFYGLYYKRFQPEYFASFMPGLTLMGALAIDHLSLTINHLSTSVRRSILLVTLLSISLLNLLTFNYQLQNPRGGTFYLKSLNQIVSWVKSNTSPNDEIFTAAVSVPLFSGRPLALDISRPVIFGYPHITPDIKYDLFPTTTEIMTYIDAHNVKYYLVEKSTRDSFYTGHDDLKAYLESNYRHLKTFDNPTNPIEVLVRRD